MSEPSDESDKDYDLEPKGDEDFKIDDNCEEIDSDDSYCDVPETNNDSNNIFEKDEVEQHEEYIGPVLPGGHRFDRTFISIMYPGNVVNSDKAIETLGGISSISTAVNTPNRRLELKFRPDEPCCKPACGDKYNTKGFLLRVRVKKSRVEKVKQPKEKGTKEQFETTVNITNNVQSNMDSLKSSDTQKNKNQNEPLISELANQVQGCSIGTMDDGHFFKEKKNMTPTFEHTKYEDLSEDKDYELPKLKVLGRIDTEFRFRNLIDFQYLPLAESKSDPKKLECIYNKIYPINIPHFSWLKNDVPYFLPPATFSRMGTVQQYVPKTEINSYPENVIGRSRKRKTGFSNFIYFSTPEVPTKPPAGIETALKVKFVQSEHIEQMRKIFEERPIWSKNALMYETKFSNDRLKILLPSVAYYFMTGPWKIMWVKLGYDPRKDISARKYQTLDYRLKAMHGLGSTVKCKRNYSMYTLPYKSTPAAKQKTILKGASSQEQNIKKEQDLNENVYIYREGTVPPSRQMFYQYCDVLVDEIQEMLAKLPDPLPGIRCHEKRGWLPNGFDAQCREIINRQVRTVLRKQMNIPEDHPTSLPRKRKRGIRVKRDRFKTRKKKKESVSSAEESEEK
ncbi:general transcription factor 3C polypeptide 5 [Hylaeus anthracinus]|uniref:general transcription factor 3C polypeptide 5 n=1 Tax=Hylaeus anthracinus TaxID=313031 RepID=UPI0023B8E5B8|nr:general transcription factor 3C polypeptide 5 [Hylaeus anthracinus]